jgi:NADH-quinone oxidoreductase subunit M
VTGTWLLPAIVLLPLTGALLLLVASHAADSWALPFATAVSAVVLALCIGAAIGYDRTGGNPGDVVDRTWVPQLGLHLHLALDGISLPLVLLSALLTLLAIGYSWHHLPEPGRPATFMALLLLLEVGTLGTFLAADLLLFFVFFEVVLVPMWFVVAWWGSGDRRRAANVFILYTVAGSLVMLVGILLIWVRSGTTDMQVLAEGHGSLLSPGVQLAAALLVGLGLAVKTPMWPLHTWLPEAHTAAPTVGSVLLAGVLLKMGTYGLIRIVVPIVPEGARTLAPYLGAFAVVGIIYGGFASLAQTDLKRLVAFSSVGHMGFVLLGIASLTQIGISGALFANVAHGLITGLLFFLAGAIKDRHGTSDFARLARGLYGRAPRLGFLLAFAAVASLGLPGLAGFWGEFLAMVGSYQPAGSLPVPLFRTFLAVAALGTVLATWYLLRMVRRVDQGSDLEPAVADVQRLEWVSWTPLVALVLLLGLAPQLLIDTWSSSLRHLLGGG